MATRGQQKAKTGSPAQMKELIKTRDRIKAKNESLKKELEDKRAKPNAEKSSRELTKLEKDAEKRSEQRRKNTRAGNAGLSSKRLNRMEAEAERKSAERRNKKPMTDAEKRMIKRIADKQSQDAQNKGDAKLKTTDKRPKVSKQSVDNMIKTATDKAKNTVGKTASTLGRVARAGTGVGALLAADKVGAGSDVVPAGRENAFVKKMDAERRSKEKAQGRGRGDGAAEVRARQAEKNKQASTKSSTPKAPSTPSTSTSQGEPRSIAEAKRMGKDYFIGKDGKRKAAVTAEELKASGMSLRDYLNKQKGKTRMAKGGMVKANCGASMPPAQKSSKGNK